MIDSDQKDEESDDKIQIQAGDYVQWESQGVLQFSVPRKVTGFSEDEEWAFVEGSNTGAPVSMN